MIRPSATLATVGACLALSMAASTHAQDWRNDQAHRMDDRRGPPMQRQDFRDGRQFDRAGFPQPRSEWRRGGRVPSEYLGRNYVVDDWRLRHLQPPPRGYQWIAVGGDFVLAAIATGVIAQIITGQ